MRRWVTSLVLLTGMAATSGCQCTPLTEVYADIIDDVTDHQIVFDDLYDPRFDLNRIGKPDWCQGRLNRMWCRYGCCARSID